MMYKRDLISPATILIVKTSSLGDIIQTLPVLEALHALVPNVLIDWAVDPAFHSLVSAHPLVRKAIPTQLKKLVGIKDLRKESYDLLFDLQGNCKSGLITSFARAKVKVGYGFQTAREWPAALASHIRFNVSKEQNIRTFYLELIERYFSRKTELGEGIRFAITPSEEEKVRKLTNVPSLKIMVCPGSKWTNKQLLLETWNGFLQRIEARKKVTFFLMWGSEEEKAFVQMLQVKQKVIVEKLSFPTWQNLMNEMDLILAVDSGALHLSATTRAPSFSIFGPTKAEVFRPLGSLHASIQGSCPFKQTFEKQCPILRSCKSGACMKNLNAEELFQALQSQCGFLQL